MTLYDVVLDLRTSRAVEDITDDLAGLDVVVQETAEHHVEVRVRLPATTLRQALLTSLSAIEDRAGGRVVALEVTCTRSPRRPSSGDFGPAAPYEPAHPAWLSPLLAALDGAGRPVAEVPATGVRRPTALKLVR